MILIHGKLGWVCTQGLSYELIILNSNPCLSFCKSDGHAVGPTDAEASLCFLPDKIETEQKYSEEEASPVKF